MKCKHLLSEDCERGEKIETKKEEQEEGGTKRGKEGISVEERSRDEGGGKGEQEGRRERVRERQ